LLEKLEKETMMSKGI